MESTLNILLADDDRDDHEFFREAIASLNLVKYNIIPANDGVEAIDYLLKRNYYEEVPTVVPDFIVLDLNMPRQDGFDTLKKIKDTEELKNIPVYILTTSWMETHVKKCREMGAAGYFTKPSRISDLKASIQKMIIDLR